ncbi:MAG TPA: NAD-glutamate dehydrogenase [Mycobacterium sp.]|nr:NAD-glutamate dehydrogenase [Mycobacterium sp.]
MAIDPGAKQDLKPWTTFTNAQDIPDWISRAYIESYRGPHDEESPAALTGPIELTDAASLVTPAMLGAHYRLGQHRPHGESCVGVYRADDPAGFGPALQVVTDHGGMLMDSVTVLLHRLGVTYAALMTPVFEVHRSPTGELLSVEPKARDAPQYVGEAWMHMQLPLSVDSKALAEVERLLPKVLGDVQRVATDAAALIATLCDVAADVEANAHDQFSAPDRNDVAALLRWLADGNFLLLGYQRCRVHDGLVSGDGSPGLGVLRTRTGSRPRLTDDDKLLVLAQSVVGSYLRYGAYPYAIAVREYVDGGVVEHRFVGLFTVAAMNADVLEIPTICNRVREALTMADRDPVHPGQLLLDVIQTVPRPELFALSGERLFAMAKAVVDLASQRRALLFLRADRLQYFVSCLVYVPRDRYTTAVRLQIEDILVREFGGTRLEFTARVSESPWALMHFMVRLPENAAPVDISEANRVRIQALLSEAARTWGDRLIGAAGTGSVTPDDAEHYAAAFSEAYKQAITPGDAIEHIAIINELTDDSVKLVFSDRGEDGLAQLTWFLGGHSASLSQLLPMLQSMGVVVLEERPFTVTRPDGLPVWIYQFKISPHPTIPLASTTAERDAMAERFADAVTAIWQGRVEIDRFNELVMRARLTWQQVVLMRAYAKYLRQANFPYSQSHIETVLNDHPSTVRSLVVLFEALFDPRASGSKTSRDAQAAAAAVAADIDALVGLDTDRILRGFASLVQATLRTNYFVTREGSARARNVLAIKLDAQLIEELPLPRPKFEISVYSPRVEGVHLRFGPVARGGLRWSDRRDDFRTEILGLVKAQAVKNAVIVPVGAKGGFVLKRPPLPTGDAAGDRDALRAEGVACYQLFISGLLDVTDNVDHLTGKVSAPPEVIRRDGDDAYLVVAADKGTATFSDIANGVAKSYGFWLGDAFASGGSVGYDHKAMGITAKGAWEAVKRHFREMGVDTQTEDFTVVGIGDMSGDVFGNGMLLSKHIRLLAAFDHRHVFLDPDPDAAASWRERQRMFDLPRSSWDDYDQSLISEGGGVYSREQKAIPVSPQVRDALGIDGSAEDGVTEMAPPNLIKAILQAPVDLLFNGGIGTYIKAETESDADVGDRANDPVRINANQVRAKVIGEGGNLGVTALGRVEFDLAGGRINTDAMDNSAGVDCSDHEVNIKILIDSLVTAGKVKAGERKQLLESMTDEVAQLVLTDNEDQNDLIGTSRANAASLLPVHAMQIKYLVEERGVNRELEALPSEKEIHRRTDAGIGLTSPELSTLMAHVKLGLKEEMLTTELPEQDVFASRVPQYFPAPLRDRFTPEIRTHQLRREIVTTMLINDLVDTAGISYAFRISEDVGVGPIDAIRTYVATDAIFGVGHVWRRIRAASMPVAVSDRMTLDTRRLIDRAGRWLLNYRPQPLAVGAEINRFAAKVKALTPRMSEWLRGDDKAIVEKEAAEFASQGAPKDLAYRVAVGLYRYSLLDIIDIADIIETDTAEVADTYFGLMDRLGTDGLLTAVSELPRNDRWHALARLAIRDDIYSSVRSLCFDVLAVGEPDESGEEKIAEWEHISASRVERARRILIEIQESGAKDLATLSVAARQIRRMTRTSGKGSSS